MLTIPGSSKSGSDEEGSPTPGQFNFEWSVVDESNKDVRKLFLKLEFENPNEISKSDLGFDSLKVMFRDKKIYNK